MMCQERFTDIGEEEEEKKERNEQYMISKVLSAVQCEYYLEDVIHRVSYSQNTPATVCLASIHFIFPLVSCCIKQMTLFYIYVAFAHHRIQQQST